MRIVVLKESSADEIRAALVPESVKKLVAAGNKIIVHRGKIRNERIKEILAVS